jgi:hypothetical protein
MLLSCIFNKYSTISKCPYMHAQQNGCVRIAKFLLKIPNNNIIINNTYDDIFDHVCDMDIIDIATILNEYNENYIFEIEDDEIKHWFIKMTQEYDKINIEICPVCMDKSSSIITDCSHQLCKDCYYEIKETEIFHVCHVCENYVKKYNIVT